MSESTEQQILFRWAAMMEGKHPELALMFHIPNEGARTKATGGRLKAEGLKAGVPDIFLPVARGGKHGLFIEMKSGKNRPTKSQSAWLEALTREGYCCAACWGFEAARDEIERYLAL